MRQWTITQTIDFVLWGAEKPLTADEIFRRLPEEMLAYPIDKHQFWQFFGMMLKRKNRPVRQLGQERGTRRYFVDRGITKN